MKIPIMLIRNVITVGVDANRSACVVPRGNNITKVYNRALWAASKSASAFPMDAAVTPHFNVSGQYRHQHGLDLSSLREKGVVGMGDVARTGLGQKAMSVRERVFTFPTSVLSLWKDWLLYQNIRDAATTSRNAWSTKEHRLQKSSLGAENDLMESTSACTIPWRQLVHQRQFISSLIVVLPTVALWMIPIVGYIPMFLSIAAPRQLLSRHFHNQFEMFHFNRLAYRQRHAHYSRVQQSLQAQLISHMGNAASTEKIASAQMHQFTPHSKKWNETNPVLYHAMDRAGLFSVKGFSRGHLVEFALAIGVYETIPPPWDARLAQWSPTLLLQRQVRTIAVALSSEDVALREYFNAKKHSLSDIEIMDACLFRGYPVDQVSFSEMKDFLFNHLRMVDSIRHCIAQGNLEMTEESIGLLTLHLAIMRDSE